jgi:urease gamma subunit
MELTAREQDKLLPFTTARLGAPRRPRGLRLADPEDLALIGAGFVEGTRGAGAAATWMRQDETVCRRTHGIEDSAEVTAGIRVEATLPIADVAGHAVRADGRLRHGAPAALLPLAPRCA